MDALLDYTNKTVLLTGAASGMGRATALALVERGARVVGFDVVPIGIGGVSEVFCDLSDEISIDRAFVQLPNGIDVLMNCAGVPNGGQFDGPTVMAINFLGLRHLTERVLTRMGPGSSVVHIASTAGRAWQERTDVHRELVGASSYGHGQAWVAANRDLVGDGYVFSKETVQFYTHWRAVQLLHRGIRMNSVCPGITDTGIIGDFRRGMGDAVIDQAQAIAGRIAQPEEMAPAMLFLGSQAASSYITGVNLNVDSGTAAARLSDQTNPAAIWPS